PRARREMRVSYLIGEGGGVVRKHDDVAALQRDIGDFWSARFAEECAIAGVLIDGVDASTAGNDLHMPFGNAAVIDHDLRLRRITPDVETFLLDDEALSFQRTARAEEHAVPAHHLGPLRFAGRLEVSECDELRRLRLRRPGRLPSLSGKLDGLDPNSRGKRRRCRAWWESDLIILAGSKSPIERDPNR